MSGDDDALRENRPATVLETETALPQAIALKDQRDEDLSDENTDDVILARPQWGGISTLASAASFDLAVPSIVAAASANLFWNVERNGEFSISNGGGSLETTFQQMFGLIDENGKKKDDDDAVDAYVDGQERRAETDREMRERWSRDEHELGGVTMTGDEWQDLGEELHKDSSLRRSLIERLMKQGRTRQEATKKAMEIADAATIMGKPESEWTPAEKEKIERVKTDPAFTANAQWLQKQRQGTSYGESNDAEVTSTAANRSGSINIGDDVLAGSKDSKSVSPTASLTSVSTSRSVSEDFPTAPNLPAHYEAALAATMPLDAPKPTVKVAALTPTPAPGSGFDV